VVINHNKELDWDKFFKECESLVDVKRFNNLIKWLDRKGISEIERYKEEIKKGRKYGIHK